jgi:hypothetical protein
VLPVPFHFSGCSFVVCHLIVWHSFIFSIYHHILWYFNHFDSQKNAVLLLICDHIEHNAIHKDWKFSDCHYFHHFRCQLRFFGRIFHFRERLHCLLIQLDMKLIFIFIFIFFFLHIHIQIQIRR